MMSVISTSLKSKPPFLLSVAEETLVEYPHVRLCVFVCALKKEYQEAIFEAKF